MSSEGGSDLIDNHALTGPRNISRASVTGTLPAPPLSALSERQLVASVPFSTGVHVPLPLSGFLMAVLFISLFLPGMAA